MGTSGSTAKKVVSARVITGVAVQAGLLLFAIDSARGVPVDIGPKAVLMQTENKYKPALFPHRKHQGWFGCTACHHVKGQTMEIDKCAACHNETLQNQDLNHLRKAAHALCKDCHNKEYRKGKETVPRACAGCHLPVP